MWKSSPSAISATPRTISIVGIVASFPIGIALALGRRSQMPVIKALCVSFIELVRGVPLVTVLFMASVMLPLFFPPGWSIDKVMRALVGVSLFSGAYMAEVIRGGLQAIPKENLKTVIDESSTAVGGLGPELNRLVDGSIALSIDARDNLDPMIALIEKSGPVMDSQSHTAGAINTWTSNLAGLTTGLKNRDADLTGLLVDGGTGLAEGTKLIAELRPTLPILLTNMVSIGQVALTYQPNIEQLLVLFPQVTAEAGGTFVANKNTKQDYRGEYLSFNLNLNLPPPCTTGFLPADQRRTPVSEDYPDRPAGDLYCRTPQNGAYNVRGAKNAPCATRPGKRAPTVKLCESNEEYVPLNDGEWRRTSSGVKRCCGKGARSRPRAPFRCCPRQRLSSCARTARRPAGVMR